MLLYTYINSRTNLGVVMEDENSQREKQSLKYKAVWYINKTFSASHAHKIFNLEINNKKENIATNEKTTETVTTENVIPLLIEEAKREEATKDMMQSTMETVKSQRSKKKRALSIIFLVLNLAILIGILIYQFINEEPVSFQELLSSKLNWWWLIIAIVLFMLINIVDAIRVYLAVKKATGRSRPWTSFKSTICCRFYDSITPLATGGQPFQVYYLSKRGLNASSATSVPLAKYIYSQTTYILFVFIMMLFGSGIIQGANISPFVMTLAYVGLSLNLLLIFAIIWLSVSKKIAPRMVIGILKLLNKMHLVKDYRGTFRKLMRTVKEYISTFRMFMKSGWLVFGEFLLSVVVCLLGYSVPFVVYCIFCPFDINLWFTFAILQMVCDMAVSFIPIPGGAGTAELSFSSAFAPYFTNTGVFVWAMLFWRILTYYGYLIQGGLLLLYDFAIGNKKIEPMLQRFKDEEQRAKESNLEKVIKESNPNLEDSENIETTNTLKEQEKTVKKSKKKLKKKQKIDTQEDETKENIKEVTTDATRLSDK